VSPDVLGRLEEVEGLLRDLAPVEWERFDALRRHLGLACPVTGRALRALYEEAVRKDEDSVRQTLAGA
jgi:hypothetical protein